MRLCNHCSSENWNCMRYLWLYTLKKKQFENSHCQNYVKKVPSSKFFQKTRKIAWDWSIFSIPEIKIACYICYFTSRIKNELGAHTYQMHAKQKFKTSKVTHIPEITTWATIVLCGPIFSEFCWQAQSKPQLQLCWRTELSFIFIYYLWHFGIYIFRCERHLKKWQCSWVNL